MTKFVHLAYTALTLGRINMLIPLFIPLLYFTWENRSLLPNEICIAVKCAMYSIILCDYNTFLLLRHKYVKDCLCNIKYPRATADCRVKRCEVQIIMDKARTTIIFYCDTIHNCTLWSNPVLFFQQWQPKEDRLNNYFILFVHSIWQAEI